MREADVMEEQRRLADSVALKALRFIDQLLSGRAHIQVQVGAMPVQVRLVAGDGVEPEDAGRPVPPHGSGP